MISITLSSEISEACPDLPVLAIACQVKNTEPDERLWEEITRVEEDIRSTCKIEDINKWTPIFATRQANWSPLPLPPSFSIPLPFNLKTSPG